MDAFAVSVCKGLSMKSFNNKKMLIIGCYFGFFQFIMPVIGYYIGNSFGKIVENIDHWIAFFLLGAIGLNMIKESFSSDKEKINDKLDFYTMIVLAIATSIDALAVGVTFAFYNTKIFLSAIMIGTITFFLSCIGVKIGFKFGSFLKNKAEFLGGTLLLFIGLKILFEDLGINIINFLK